jgi:UDP-glucuronate 4-epimerase
MRVLVTGAAGFIGSNLCDALIEKGHEVFGVDAFTENYPEEEKRRNLSRLQNNSNFQFNEMDLLTSEIPYCVEGMDTVFHLAGQPSVHNSWGKEFNLYIQRNVELTNRLLQAAHKFGVKKFINSSSSSVYGRVLGTPTKETDPKSPISPYGVTKLAAENLVTLFGSEMGLNTVSLRYFTVYGPNQRPDMAFRKLINAGMNGEPFPLHGDGRQLRDFTFVSDVIQANLLAAEKEIEPGSIFNIGGGSPISMIDAIRMIEINMGVEIKKVNMPFGVGNPFITSSDTSAARAILDWEPKVSFEKGIKAQVEWQLAQT